MFKVCPIICAKQEKSAGVWYRVVWPLAELARQGKLEVSDDAELVYVFAAWNDPVGVKKAIKGRPYVLDFDDLVWDMPHAPLQGVQEVQDLVRGAALVTCASFGLHLQLYDFGAKKVKYCRTGVNDEHVPLVMEPQEPIVAWRGSRGWWRALADIKEFLPRDLTIIHNMELLPYFKFLKTFDRTLEIIPSYPAPFEAAKSPIKLVQAAHQGVPAIYAPVPPYSISAPERLGLCYYHKEDIIPLVKTLLKDHTMRHEIGLEARHWARTVHGLEHTCHDFLEAFECALSAP